MKPDVSAHPFAADLRLVGWWLVTPVWLVFSSRKASFVSGEAHPALDGSADDQGTTRLIAR